MVKTYAPFATKLDTMLLFTEDRDSRCELLQLAILLLRDVLL
jgi:hypothetical protein